MRVVRSRDHSKDATFSLAVWRSNGGLPLAVESNPNAVAPNPAYVIKLTPKRDALILPGIALLRYVVIGGTTAITIQPWFYDDGLGLWVRFTTNISSMIDNSTGDTRSTTTVAGMIGSKWYPQVTVNNASTGVLKLGYDFG